MLDKETGLTLEKLKEYLDYNPDTGIFVWKVKPSNPIGKGSVAGGYDGDGYIKIKLFGFPYKAHRLAWFYMTGGWPIEQMDHINRIRDDNRFENLREATQIQNSQNQTAALNIKSGLKGAYLSRGLWFSTIRVNDKNIYLGIFKSALDAHNAYVSAAKFYFNEYSTDGK